jgi:hypothetical protein
LTDEDYEIEVLLVDVTEHPIERPKNKTSNIRERKSSTPSKRHLLRTSLICAIINFETPV